jgi:hypothetical protein
MLLLCLPWICREKCLSFRCQKKSYQHATGIHGKSQLPPIGKSGFYDKNHASLITGLQ